MKKTTSLVALLILLAAELTAQPILFGLTELGGNSAGSIVRYDASNNSISSVFSYPNDGISPSLQSSPIQVTGGRVYGMTNRGGRFNYGTIYTINEDGTGFRKIHDFDFVNGADPRGTLFQASNGLIYGLTLTGGSSGQGTLFRFDPLSESITKLHDFVDTDGNRQGQRPFGSLAEFGGRLFGMLSSGGANNVGSIFSIALDGSGFAKHFDFGNLSGQELGGNPYGSLFLASDNLMYGMTSAGGAFNRGVVFTFNPATFTFSKRFDFGATIPAPTGTAPFGSFIQDANNGLLYGLTTSGGAFGFGTVFSFNPNTDTYTTLHSFQNAAPDFNGRVPSGTLVQAPSGLLYGLAAFGGSVGRGTVFSVATDGSGFTVLRQLTQADGQVPYGTPLLLRTGNLMATFSQQGDGTNGTIALYSQDGSSFVEVHDFNFAQGAFPRGSLVQGRNGAFYGMTYGGGAYGQGTVFSFQPSSNTFIRLYSFQNNSTVRNGSNPFGSLTESADGTLFGMTSIGGQGNKGVIFSIQPDGSGYAVRHAFNGNDGSFPYGSLLLASNGFLYGMTSLGGTSGTGVLFSMDPVTGTYTVLQMFDGPNGASPRGSLLQASNGRLYGLTAAGGSQGLGVLFSLDPADNTFTILHNFQDDAANRGGASPTGNLAEYADGMLYGLTSLGGASDHGTIFSFDPATAAFTTLVSLDDNSQQGRKPLGSLTLASDRKFYGLTSAGGANNRGTLFSFDPATGSLEKLQDFNLENGASPLYSDLLEPGRCRPPVVRCPENINVTATAGNCSVPVSFNATTTDYCPITVIRFYLAYGTTAQTEINSGYTFPVGSNTVTAVASNLLNEQSTCTFIVTVQAGQNEICGNNVDDDCDGWVDETCTPRLRIWDTVVTEASGMARVRLTLSGVSEKIVTARYATREQSAKSPQDFTARTGQVSFTAGETVKFIEIPIVQDMLREKSEQFEVWLFDIRNARLQLSGGSPFKARVVIVDGTESATATQRTSDAWIMEDRVNVVAWPNPSPSMFRLRLDGFRNATVHIRVTDLQGRLVEQRQVAAGTKETALGAGWAQGTYFVEIMQDDQRRLLRLIKQ